MPLERPRGGLTKDSERANLLAAVQPCADIAEVLSQTNLDTLKGLLNRTQGHHDFRQFMQVVGFDLLHPSFVLDQQEDDESKQADDCQAGKDC